MMMFVDVSVPIVWDGVGVGVLHIELGEIFLGCRTYVRFSTLSILTMALKTHPQGERVSILATTQSDCS